MPVQHLDFQQLADGDPETQPPEPALPAIIPFFILSFGQSVDDAPEIHRLTSVLAHVGQDDGRARVLHSTQG